MCVDVTLQVWNVLLLTVVYAMLLTTVRCWVLFTGSENEPNSMHWMQWKQSKTDLIRFFFFLIFLYVFVL